MEFFTKSAYDFQALANFAKSFTKDVRQGPKYACWIYRRLQQQTEPMC